MIDIDKKQHWRDIEHRMSKAIDGIGERIDKGIMDTVVALNAIGINTTASCEGHLDWGCPSPWVHIGALGVDELKKDLREKMQFYQQASEENIEKAADEYRKAEQRLKPLHAKEEAKLVKYLNAFYRQHDFDYDRHLVIDHLISGECLLQSHGATMQDFREDDEKAMKLKVYQEEMQCFASFLRDCFFSGDMANV